MKYEAPEELSDTELVALVLGKKEVDTECIDLTELIVLDGVLSVGPLLDASRGTKISAVQRIMKVQAAIELGRRTLLSKGRMGVIKVNTPQDVDTLMRPIFACLDKEHFYVLSMNIKKDLLKITLVSIGCLNASIVHPRELFKTPIGLSAAAIVIAHNHPSGDSSPSNADVKLTRRLMKAGEILGIEVLDHIVFGKGGDRTSLREKGLMEEDTINEGE